ncbi:MAG: hypothetical protein HYX27_23920 [Acidobacteria bacterium]|nr:hypothetical protein [Acidobacteriota bacterium]
MPLLTRRAALCTLAAAAAPAQQSQDEDFQVYGENPRLFLNARRLRLLKRERERTSARWTQLETLIAGRAQMAEPGFAHSLYYAISGSQEFGKQAIQFALQTKDLRQQAIVFDWCQPLLSEEQNKRLAGRLRQALTGPPAKRDISTMRDRALAAVAIGHKEELERLVKQWWRKEAAPGIRAGSYRYSREDSYALFEMLHAIRDGLQIDLREDAPRYFKELPAYHILSYYPATFPAAENEYRVPFYDGDGDPDLRVAALARAADLAMVAFDTNAQETQFVQGWLIHDRFLMRGVFGIVYEFLWANPYQPGLSYYHLPLSMHAATAGRLALRSSWEDDATWFHYADRKVQFFEDGRRKDRGLASPAPVEIGGTVVHFGRDQMKFQPANAENQKAYVIGLAPNSRYDVEIDDEEIIERITDAGGILEFDFPPMQDRTVRIRRVTAT